MSKQMLVTNNPQKDTNGIIKYIWLITNKIEQEKSEGKTDRMNKKPIPRWYS